MTAKMKSKERAVLVTTSHRGVFFGYAEDIDGATILLKRCRNCICWPVEQKGFLGLATQGPVSGAKIGPAAEEFQVRDITGVAAVSDEAAVAWERAPWSR